MPIPRTRRSPRLAPLVAALLLAGCASSPSASSRDPLSVAADREAHTGVRVRAIQSAAANVQAGETDRAFFRDTLKRVAWHSGTHSSVRIAAMDALLADDEADTRNMLRLMLPRETQWPTIAHIGELASERGWTDLTPALIRSWARPVIEPADPDRPERAALLAMHSDRDLVDVVFEVFATPTDDALFGERVRLDAWTLICRIDDNLERTRVLLRERRGTIHQDPLLADLIVGATDLAAVPSTGEQLEWLRALRAPQNTGFYQDAVRAVGRIGGDQLNGFELRHASAVRWALLHRESWLEQSRESFLDDLRDRLRGRRVHQRTAETVVGVRPRRETLEHNQQDLVWGDALLILIADEALQDPAVVGALFEQVDADRKDTTTEYGGVLDCLDDGRFTAIPFPPRPTQRVGDNRFVASPELLERGHTGLFHYHFHARRADEREYAGPGPGDFEYAHRFGRSCLVFTSINNDTLNADYFQPNGARVDLGELRRP